MIDVDDGVAIREATEADIEAIQQIARETWSFTYRGVIPPHIQDQAMNNWYESASLAAQIPASTNLLLIAQSSADRSIGFAQFVQHSADLGELTRIYVLPAHHGEGVGFRLFQEGLVWLHDLGVQTLMVEVEELNPIGRRFYERNGFKEIGKTTQDIFGHPLSTVRYQRGVP